MQLMSAEQITNHDCHVILDLDFCYVQDHRIGHLVGTSPHHHDSQCRWELDWLRLPSPTPASVVSSAYAASSTSLFAQVASSSGLALWLLPIDITSSRSFHVYFRSRVFRTLSGLSIRKEGSTSLSSSESVSQHSFDLVHSDVWGLAPFVSKGGHKYYIIFIDDFYHHTWIYFMKHHNEVLSIYKNFSAMIRTHFGTSICVFQADYAGEYLSDALRQVLAEQGTLAQFSYPGAHAQNGVAECKYRHLLETTRGLMIASSISPHFWAEAIYTTIYLINIQPSLALKGGIPF
jgi:hypothetical protein